MNCKFKNFSSEETDFYTSENVNSEIYFILFGFYEYRIEIFDLELPAELLSFGPSLFGEELCILCN